SSNEPSARVSTEPRRCGCAASLKGACSSSASASCRLPIGPAAFGGGFGTCVAGGGCGAAVCAQRVTSKSMATTSRSGIPSPLLSATIFPWSLFGSETVDCMSYLSFGGRCSFSESDAQGQGCCSPAPSGSTAPGGG